MQELQNYSSAVIAISQFKEKYKHVFEELRAMEDAKIELESQLKTKVKELKQDIGNEVVQCTFVASFRKWFNFNAFSKKAQKIIKEHGAIIEKEIEIDKEKLEELAKQGILDRQELRNSYCEMPLSESVRIKIK